MNEKDPKQIKKLLEELTTSGHVQIDEIKLKTLKNICKTSPLAIPFVYENLFKQLKRNHSQVRLSSLQVIDVLFHRSHNFRELVLDQLKEIIDLILETKSSKPLPLPKDAAKSLQKLSIQTLKKWSEKYSSDYIKIKVAIDYLKKTSKIDFHDMDVRTEAQRKAEEEQARKMSNIWKERVKKLKVELKENKEDIRLCLTQINNCFDLLLPDIRNFQSDDSPEDFLKDEFDEDVDELRRAHGILNARDTLQISLTDSLSVKENKDNTIVISNLKDQMTLINNRFMPLVKKWAVILGKAGEDGDSNTLKLVIDMKQQIQEALDKTDQLKIDLTKGSGLEIYSDDSDSDDDFIEVPSNDVDTVDEDPIPGPSGIGSINYEAWCCRAPLPSGRLCPRQDRNRCPLHGKIIPRDVMGVPSSIEDKLKEQKRKEDEQFANPDWQNPQLLNDIQQATGINLKVPKKGERKKRKREESKLVDVKKLKNTSRNRLEKKIFKRCRK